MAQNLAAAKDMLGQRLLVSTLTLNLGHHGPVARLDLRPIKVWFILFFPILSKEWVMVMGLLRHIYCLNSCEK